LTITKFTLKFAEKPRVLCRRFFFDMCWSFDWTHMASLFFRSSVIAVCIRIHSNSPIKKEKKRKPSTRITLRKKWWTQTLVTRGSEEKKKVYKGELGPKSSCNLVILVRIPPNFLNKSRVLHLECTPTGVYSRKGGPRSSHFLIFIVIFMSTIM